MVAAGASREHIVTLLTYFCYSSLIIVLVGGFFLFVFSQFSVAVWATGINQWKYEQISHFTVGKRDRNFSRAIPKGDTRGADKSKCRLLGAIKLHCITKVSSGWYQRVKKGSCWLQMFRARWRTSFSCEVMGRKDCSHECVNVFLFSYGRNKSKCQTHHSALVSRIEFQLTSDWHYHKACRVAHMFTDRLSCQEVQGDGEYFTLNTAFQHL